MIVCSDRAQVPNVEGDDSYVCCFASFYHDDPYRFDHPSDYHDDGRGRSNCHAAYRDHRLDDYFLVSCDHLCAIPACHVRMHFLFPELLHYQLT